MELHQSGNSWSFTWDIACLSGVKQAPKYKAYKLYIWFKFLVMVQQTQKCCAICVVPKFRLSKLCRSTITRLGHWHCSQNLQLSSGLGFWSAAAWTWTLTWTLQPDQGVVKVLSLNTELCAVWILLRSVEESKTEASKVTTSTLTPQDDLGWTRWLDPSHWQPWN